MRLIRAEKQVSFLVTAATWLLILVLPAVLLRASLEQFLQHKYRQSVQRMKPLLFTELQRFKADLEYTGILENELRAFNRTSGYVELSASEMQMFCLQNPAVDAGNLKVRLEKHLGIPVFAVFAHGPDTSSVDAAITHDAHAEMTVPPKTMLRRFFALVNRQHEMAAIDRAFQPAFSAGTDLEDVRTILAYHENFLQRMIGTAVGFRIEPDRVFRSLASRVGDSGPVFIYYARSHARRGDREFNLGGYLMVIRASDIPERHIVGKAVARNYYSQLRRRVTALPMEVPAKDNFRDLGLSRFVEHHDRLALQAMVAPRQIVRMIQKGTIVPRDFANFAGKTAGLEVSCQRNELQHPLARHIITIDLLLKLLVLAGSMLMARLYLFGFDFNVSLALKTSAAVLAAAALPLLSLLLGLVAYRDFAGVARNDRIQRYLKIGSSEVRNLIAERKAWHEQQHCELAISLAGMKRFSDAQIEEYLKNWISDRPIHQLLYKRLDASIMHVSAGGSRSDAVQRSVEATTLVMQSIVEHLLCSPLVNPDVASMSKLLTETSMNVDGTNSMMMSNGRILNLPKFSRHVRVAFVPVIADEMGRKTPTAVVGIVYSLEKLSEEMFMEVAQKIPLQRKLDDMHLDFAFGEVQGRAVKCRPDRRSDRLSPEFIEEQMLACNSLQHELQWSGTDDEEEFFSLTSQDQTLPIINLVRITRRVGGGWLQHLSPIQWFFPVLLLLLVLLLSKMFFIEPALKFSAGLSAIARGELTHRLPADGGDEFAELAADFNLMAKSLQEKEMLESYVSPDVLREARSASVANLQPGGEKISATVAFVSLLPKSDQSSGHGHASLLKRINRLLDVGQILCGEYGGVIDKVISHSLMLVFRETTNDEAHQIRACRMVTHIRQSVSASDLAGSCRLAAGLACGQLVSGKIGSRNGRLDFTVIGDTVNLAARLKSYAEGLTGSPILVSEEVRAALATNMASRLESEVQLKGKSMQTRVYRID